MPSRSHRSLLVALALCVAFVAFSAPSSAVTTRGSAEITYKGAFEFEGNAARTARKGCRGEGVFGTMKAGARVQISEQNAAGDFDVIGRSKLRAGKIVDASDGEEVCRMVFRVKATAPADDSRVHLEIKNVAFSIAFPVSDVADGDLGTWRCEFSDDSCAEVVGGV